MEKRVQKNLPNLDELDLMLIQAIEENARSSYQEIASNVGTSPQTVRRRLDRLIDRGILKIVATSDNSVLGYEVVLVLAINTPAGTLDILTEQLANINSIKFAWVTTGRYDILAIAMYRDFEEYLKLFSEEMGCIPENVRIETLTSIKEIKRSWSHLTDNGAITKPSDFTPTELDLSIMRGLCESPRAPVTELAKTIGANPSSVRFGLNKLLSKGVIQVVGVTDPEAFGYTVRGITLIQIHPSRMEAVTNQLKSNPSVKQGSLMLGAFNCMIWTSFQSAEQLHHFLVQDLGKMPGVVHYESLMMLEAQKVTFNLPGESRSSRNT